MLNENFRAKNWPARSKKRKSLFGPCTVARTVSHCFANERTFLLLFASVPMCCAVLCCTVLYCAVLYCTVLYCTVLYCAVLCCTVVSMPYFASFSLLEDAIAEVKQLQKNEHKLSKRIASLDDTKQNLETKVRSPPDVCTHHTCIHTYIHAYIRTYIRTHKYIRTYVHTHTYVRTHTHTYIRTNIHTCIRMKTHSCRMYREDVSYVKC